MTFAITQPWALYNEIDEYAASWTENLIARGLIAPGIVDRRSIEDIQPDELRGFRQVHFFSGIAVWSYALRRAGVSDDTALWTGSCPCQPFSAAGKGGGMDDERHLWPAFLHHIRERRPERVLGEQVASKDGLGWLDLVCTDMEEAGYAIGALDTCSASSGAPHIRQRLRFAAYDTRSAAGWVQHASGDRRFEWGTEPSGRGSASGRSFGILGNAENNGRLRGISGEPGGAGSAPQGSGELEGYRRSSIADAGAISGLGHHHHQGLEGFGSRYQAALGRLGAVRSTAETSELSGLADDRSLGRTDGSTLPRSGSAFLGQTSEIVGTGDQRNTSRLANAEYDDWWADFEGRVSEGRTLDGRSGPACNLADTDGWDPSAEWQQRSGQQRQQSENCRGVEGQPRPRPTNGFWADADWVFCRDGKWRPIEPGTFPLAHGAPARVGRLRAYGNAVDAEATTDFIEAVFAHGRIEIDGDQAGIDHHPRLENLGFEDLLG